MRLGYKRTCLGRLFAWDERLVTLLNRFTVSASADGFDRFDALTISVRNSGHVHCHWEIPAGSLFEASDGQYQNLITRETVHGNLEPGEQAKASVYAYCGNAARMSPRIPMLPTVFVFLG